MLTSNEIRQVTFDKVMRGYNVDDVIAFLDDIASQMETLEATKQDFEKKVYVLAEKVAEYRGDEENLKTALINAQRLGEKVITEAKQKADILIKEASNRAQQIEDAAKTAVEDEKIALSKIQADVAEFKNNILNLYRQHIESLSTIPEPEEIEQLVEETETEQEIVPVVEPQDSIQPTTINKQEPEEFVDNSAVGAFFNNF